MPRQQSASILENKVFKQFKLFNKKYKQQKMFSYVWVMSFGQSGECQNWC